MSDTDGRIVAVITGYCVSADGTFLTARRLVPEILDDCPIKTIRGFFRKCWRYMDAYRYDYTSFIHTFDLNFTQEGSKCETGGVRREKIQIPSALWANGDDEHRYVVELTPRSWAVIRRRGVILLNTVTPMYVYGNSDNRRFKFTFRISGSLKSQNSKNLTSRKSSSSV
jgi:hypothetical protein